LSTTTQPAIGVDHPRLVRTRRIVAVGWRRRDRAADQHRRQERAALAAARRVEAAGDPAGLVGAPPELGQGHRAQTEAVGPAEELGPGAVAGAAGRWAVVAVGQGHRRAVAVDGAVAVDHRLVERPRARGPGRGHAIALDDRGGPSGRGDGQGLAVRRAQRPGRSTVGAAGLGERREIAAGGPGGGAGGLGGGGSGGGGVALVALADLERGLGGGGGGGPR
jgi:hypothetical protein